MKEWKKFPLVLLLLGALMLSGVEMMSQSGKAVLTKKDIDQMMTSLSNWGRWGKKDELGALNLLTPTKRREAADLVKEGVTISLARNAIKVKEENSEPFDHRMVETGTQATSESSSDVYSVQYHGYTQTHLDALCHLFYQGKMYNGFTQQEVSAKGASKLSVIQAKNGIFTRGVLLDLPSLLGVDYLKGAQAIYPEQLEAWEKKTGVKITSGDALLIRTGRWARRAAQGTWNVEGDSAGLHASCLPWIKKRDISVLGSDLAADVMPSGVEGVRMPVHQVIIIAMGVPILDNCDLEELSKSCVKRKRWDFLLVVAPLAVDGGTGSPVNPVATF
jgi:kynurenine formamidase